MNNKDSFTGQHKDRHQTSQDLIHSIGRFYNIGQNRKQGRFLGFWEISPSLSATYLIEYQTDFFVTSGGSFLLLRMANLTEPSRLSRGFLPTHQEVKGRKIIGQNDTLVPGQFPT